MALEEGIVQHVLFPDLDARVALAGEGYYLPSRAELTVGVKTVNATEIKLRLEELYRNNIVEFVRDGYSRYGGRYTITGRPERTIEVGGAWNAWQETPVDLADLLGERPTGTFILTAALEKHRWRAVFLVQAKS